MVNKLYVKYRTKRTQWTDINDIKSKLRMSSANRLSRAQKSDISSYYKKKLGRNVPTYWHEYFYSRNGLFSVQYVPTSVYHSDIIYFLNNFKVRHAYVDKAFYDVFFPDVNRPKTIIKNINGYFYNENIPISKDDAFFRCLNLSQVVIKPTINTWWGRGVDIISTQSGHLHNGWSVKDLFKKYKKNFIIQEKVKQHEKMAKLNPTSLNTVRVLSYRDNREVFVLYSVLRIGRAGQIIDNETAGGINVDIDLDSGTIRDFAYGSSSERKIYKTDNGTLLKGFTIPSFHKIPELVKTLHLRLPYFNLIGWDFGIDHNSNPVLIEWNRCPDLSQTAHGPAFGEMTEEIFKRVKTLPDTRLVSF